MIGTNFGIYRPSTTQQPIATSVAKKEDPQPVHQLSDFVVQLEDYVPTIPDAVTSFYLNSAGFDSNDPRIIRLISIATQKFISDVANDALHNCKIRHGATNNTKIPRISKDKKYTLTNEDLAPALADYGIIVRKAHYFP